MFLSPWVVHFSLHLITMTDKCKSKQREPLQPIRHVCRRQCRHHLKKTYKDLNDNMQILQTIQAYTLSWVCLFKTIDISITGRLQKSVYASLRSFSGLLMKKELMNSQELQLFLHTQIYCYFTGQVTENWSLA